MASRMSPCITATSITSDAMGMDDNGNELENTENSTQAWQMFIDAGIMGTKGIKNPTKANFGHFSAQGLLPLEASPPCLSFTSLYSWVLDSGNDRYASI